MQRGLAWGKLCELRVLDFRLLGISRVDDKALVARCWLGVAWRERSEFRESCGTYDASSQSRKHKFIHEHKCETRSDSSPFSSSRLGDQARAAGWLFEPFLCPAAGPKCRNMI
jgi:hypothetical protein